MGLYALAEMLLINAVHAEKGSSSAIIAASLNRVRARVGMPSVDALTLADPQKVKQLVRKEKW
jgi:hypothetical protein